MYKYLVQGLVDWTHGIDGGAEGATPNWHIEEQSVRAPLGARRGATRYAHKGACICHLVLRIGYFDWNEKESNRAYKKLLVGGFSGPSAFIIANFAAKFGTRVLWPKI